MGFLDRFKGLKLNKKLNVNSRFFLRKKGISGTMSKFYMVEEKETQKIYGLKILDREKTDQVEARYRALKVKKPSEGEISMMFDHPYIVKTLEYGLTTENEQYILMEYLGGTGLNNILMVKDDLLAGGRVGYIRQCAEGLMEVHKKGFIHRDVYRRRHHSQTDRFRSDCSERTSIHRAGKPHGQPQLHRPGTDPPSHHV